MGDGADRNGGGHEHFALQQTFRVVHLTENFHCASRGIDVIGDANHLAPERPLPVRAHFEAQFESRPEYRQIALARIELYPQRRRIGHHELGLHRGIRPDFLTGVDRPLDHHTRNRTPQHEMLVDAVSLVAEQAQYVLRAQHLSFRGFLIRFGLLDLLRGGDTVRVQIPGALQCVLRQSQGRASFAEVSLRRPIVGRAEYRQRLTRFDRITQPHQDLHDVSCERTEHANRAVLVPDQPAGNGEIGPCRHRHGLRCDARRRRRRETQRLPGHVHSRRLLLAVVAPTTGHANQCRQHQGWRHPRRPPCQRRTRRTCESR